MSVPATNWVLENSRAEGTSRLMLLVIADSANDWGACWRSVASLAARTRVSVRQAQRLIGQLAEDGHVTVDRGTGRGNTSVITIAGMATAPSVDADPERVTFMAERVTPMSPFSEERVTPMSPFSEERVTSSVRDPIEKGDIFGKKGDIFGIKGDMPPHAHGEPNTTQYNPGQHKTSSSSSWQDRVLVALNGEEDERPETRRFVDLLEAITKRPATQDERHTLSEGCKRYNEAAVRAALNDLGMAYHSINSKHSVGGWLRTSIKNHAGRAAPAVDDAAARRLKYTSGFEYAIT